MEDKERIPLVLCSYALEYAKLIIEYNKPKFYEKDINFILPKYMLYYGGASTDRYRL